MKKLLALLFASVLILGACGSKDDSSKDSSDSDSSNKSSESKKDSGNTDSVKVDSSDDDKKKSDSKFENDKLTSKDFDIEILDTEIVDASKYADDDKPNIAIVYGVKKKTDKEDVTASSAFSQSFEAYQDSKDVKRKLETGDAYDSKLDRKYGDNDTDEINKGGKVKAVKFFKLKDTKTPVTLNVEFKIENEPINIILNADTKLKEKIDFDTKGAKDFNDLSEKDKEKLAKEINKSYKDNFKKITKKLED